MTQATDALTYLLFSAELQSRTQPANREQALRKIALIQALAGQPSSLSALDRELKLGPIVEGEGEDEDKPTSRARRDRLPGGVGDSLPDEKFDPDQLAIGIRHEMEHTDDEELAKEIAKDHLAEDPDYYTKLAQIEESWDESKHPRDHGKFAKKEGGSTLADKMPGGKAAHPQPSKTILQRAIQIAVSSSPAAIAAKHIARQAGFSERTATILSVVASVGDWSIPGVPAGSSAVIVGALLKRPTVAIAVSQEMMRKARSLVREVALSVVGSFRESEKEKIVDEEALLAIGEWLESVDDQEWATAVLAAAMEEADGNFEKALTIAEQVMKFGSQLAEAEEDEDPQERAEAIAELLLSVYGEDALKMFDEDKSESRVLESLLEEWNPDAHPRGANGRFIKKNSPEAVAATKGAIKDSLRKPRSGDTFQELMEHLNILTTKQIRELSKEYGVSAGGRVKAELVEKIAKRLDVGRRGENEDLSQEEFPTYDEWAKGEREKRRAKKDPQEPSPVVAQETPLTQVWTKKGKFDFVQKNNDGTVVYLDDSGKEQTTDPNERYTLVNPSTVKPLPSEKDYSKVTVRTVDGEFPVVKKHSDGTVSYKDADGTVRQTKPDDRIFVNDPDAAEYNRKLKRMEREEKAASAKKQKEIDAQRPNVKAVPPTKSINELSRLADQQFVAMKASGNPVDISGADRLKALAGDVTSGKKINPDQLLDILTQYARPESPTMPEAINTLNELARHAMSFMSKDELQGIVEKADREAEMGGTGVPGAIAELKADQPLSGQDGPQEGDRNAGRENSSQKDLTTSTTGDAINTGDEKQPVSSGGGEMKKLTRKDAARQIDDVLTEEGYRTSVWSAGDKIRVYVRDKKGREMGYLNISPKGDIESELNRQSGTIMSMFSDLEIQPEEPQPSIRQNSSEPPDDPLERMEWEENRNRLRDPLERG